MPGFGELRGLRGLQVAPCCPQPCSVYSSSSLELSLPPALALARALPLALRCAVLRCALNDLLCCAVLHPRCAVQATSPSFGTATAVATWTPSWRSSKRCGVALTWR